MAEQDRIAIPPDLLAWHLQQLHASAPQRLGHGATDGEVAAAVGVSRQYYWGLRTGKAYGSRRDGPPQPSAEVLARVADFWRVPVDLFRQRPEDTEVFLAEWQVLGLMKQAGIQAIQLRAAADGPEGMRALGAFLMSITDRSGTATAEPDDHGDRPEHP